MLRELIADNGCSIACIQLTKLQLIEDAIISEALGTKFVGHYAVMPAQGTKGGTVVACSQDHYTLSTVDIRQYSVSMSI